MWCCNSHLGLRASCAKHFPAGSKCLHWVLTTNIITSFPNENTLWWCYFIVILPPHSFLHLNLEPERPTRAGSPLASKHCDSQYFPKTTSILSPCLQTNRQRFWGPGWLVILRGWKKNYRMLDLHQSARGFLSSGLPTGVRTRHLLLYLSANAQETLKLVNLCWYKTAEVSKGWGPAALC